MPPILPTAIIPVGKKRALCFGINNYGGPNNLRGCLNDIADWSKLLKDAYKFDEVATMTDSQCTRENIMKAMQDIIEKSNAGDVVVLQYSGHGTEILDKNGDEADGKDECICLYNGLLIDDEINTILSKIKEGVKTTIIFDSCFSGTSTRAFNFNEDAFYRVARFMPPKDEGKMMGMKLRNRAFKAIGQNEEDMNHVLISGASNTEFSYDAEFGGTFFGAMSYFATRVLKENPVVTYSEFHKKLREKLPNQQYPQNPQLEGKNIDKSRIMFS